MASTELYTYDDVVELLSLTLNVQRDAINHRLVRAAVLNAYRDLPHQFRWSYFERTVQIVTSAAYSTGSIAFDLTGGSSERLVTLTSGTWPEWTAFGTLMINNVRYRIDSRLSDTTLQLASDSCPSADVASGTSYVLYRDLYPLPVGARRITKPVDATAPFRRLDYIESGVEFTRTAAYLTPTTPWMFTLRGDGEYYGGLAIQFGPPPSDAITYDVLIEAAPRQLKTLKYSTGTVSVSSGGTTVTGSGTAFTSDLIGSVIRFPPAGATSTEPTGPWGGLSADNPYRVQRIVTAVASGTSLTIDAAVSSSDSLSGVKYTISDPLDIEAGAMFTCFQRLAESQYARLANRNDAEAKEAAYYLSLKQAKCADSRYRHGPDNGVNPAWFGPDMRSFSDYVN